MEQIFQPWALGVLASRDECPEAHATLKDIKEVFTSLGAPDVLYIELKMCSQTRHPTAAKKNAGAEGMSAVAEVAAVPRASSQGDCLFLE